MPLIFVLLTAIVIAFSYSAHTQTVPTGDSTLNQASAGYVVTKSDVTVIPQTRGLHIGDATACNLSVAFSANPTVAVAIDSVQSGSDRPYSVVQVRAATTCTDVVALY